MTRRQGRAWKALGTSYVMLAVATASPAHATPGWVSPLTVAEAGQGANAQVAVAMDAKGNTLVAWVQTNKANGSIEAAWRPAGGKFEAPVDLSPASDSYAANPVIAMDPRGDATIVWTTRAQAPEQILAAATRPAGGTFAAAVNITAEDDDEAYEPRVAMDAHGDTAIASLLYNSNVYLAGDTYRPAGGTFGPLAGLYKPEVTQNATAASALALAMNAHGDTGIAWLAVRHEPSWIPRIELETRPAGGNFTSSIGTSLSLGEGQGPPAIAMNPNGEATVIWATLQAGATQTVEVFAPTPPHEPFRTPGVLAKEPGTSGIVPQIAMNAAGEATVAWSSPSHAVTVATRSAADSYSNPVTLTGSGESTGTPAVAIDEQGDSEVVWMDSNGFVEGLTESAEGKFGEPVRLSSSGKTLGPVSAAMDSQGDGVSSWVSSEGANDIVQLAGYQATGPSLEMLQAPTEGQAGDPLAFSVSPLSVWLTIASTTWSWGDGSPDTSGTGVTHVFDAAGTYQVSVSATDALGNATNATRAPSPSRPPPPSTPIPRPHQPHRRPSPNPNPRRKRRPSRSSRPCSRRKPRLAGVPWACSSGSPRCGAPAPGIRSWSAAPPDASVPCTRPCTSASTTTPAAQSPSPRPWWCLRRQGSRSRCWLPTASRASSSTASSEPAAS